MGCIISKSGNAAYAPSPVPDPELLRSRHRDVANHGPMGALSDLPRRSAKPLAREDDSASSSRHRPRNALPPHEIPLAGYLVCKTASGAPVEGQAISWLQRSNDTVHETRARFPLGRGNDAADIAATGHASSRHAQAAHDVFVDVVRDGAPRSMLMNPTLMHGAIAEFVQGGHCAGYSAVATTLHAPKLLPGETLHYVQHNLQEHDWVESRLPGAHHDAVVVDAWTRGPAVFASDSRFAGDVRQTQERLVLTAEDGKDMPAQADANAQYLRENYSAQAEAHLERLEAEDFRCPAAEVWQPQPVVSDAFLVKARQGLAVLEQASRLREVATESARALGASTKVAKASADAIITAAYQLGGDSSAAG